MFNINEFKSKLDKHGGPANSSLFTVQLLDRNPANSSSFFLEDSAFFCHHVNLPGINIVTQSHRADATGIASSMPVGIEAERLDCMFLVDDKHNVLRFFHRWMQDIYNFGSVFANNSARSTNNDHARHEIGYKSEYARSMLINHYSLDGEVYQWMFDDVFPTDIASMRASWSDGNSYMELPVHFSYGKFTVSGIDEGTTNVSTRLSGIQEVTQAEINRNATGLIQPTIPTAPGMDM